MIRDSFLDIIQHTAGLGFIELVKVVGKPDCTIIEAIDENRTVVITGKLKKPIDDLNGIIGLSRFPVLSGYLNFSPFEGSAATIAISTKNEDNEEVPCELSFNSNAGHVSSYRFMNRAMANERIKIPPFKGVQWNIAIEPTLSGLKDLASMNSILGGFESTFAVKTNGSDLEFHIGSGSNDRTKIVFATGITGTLKHTWSWPLVHVLAILKLNDKSERCTMSFSDQGALKIDIDSALGDYQYIIPARTK